MTTRSYLISDLTMLPCANVQSPRSAVGSAALGGQPSAPPLLPPGQVGSLSAYRFPLSAPGGEPFAPPRGESAVTSWFARQLQNFDKMSLCTLTLPCTMCCRAHALSRVNCTTSFVVKSGSAWSPNMCAFAEGSFAARRCCFGRPHPQSVILVVSCIVRCIFQSRVVRIVLGRSVVRPAPACGSRARHAALH